MNDDDGQVLGERSRRAAEAMASHVPTLLSGLPEPDPALVRFLQDLIDGLSAEYGSDKVGSALIWASLPPASSDPN